MIMKDTMDLEPGMVLAQDILNNYDAIVLPAGAVLTEENIMNLSFMDVDFVFIEDNQAEEPAYEAFIGEIPELEYKAPKNEEPAAVVRQETARREKFEEAVLFYKEMCKRVEAGKSIDSKAVLDVVKNLVKEFYRYDDIFSVLSKMKSEEGYEYTHTTSMCIISVLLAKWLNVPHQSIYKLAQAAYLSDLGKAMLPDEILLKKEGLTSEERIQIEGHVGLTKKILTDSGGFDNDIIHIVETHHERLNGSGYPYKIDKVCINQHARIVAVADTYHALLSNRPYRGAYSIIEATELLWNLSYSELDPRVTERLVKFITSFLVGGEVVLSNGKVGEIIMVNQYDKFRPLVRVQNEFIDLAQKRDYKIVEIVGAH